MIIQPIVEGQGDVDAVPVLLRRICYELGCCLTAAVAAPIRIPRSKMVQEAEIRRYARIGSFHPGCDLVLLFMDVDDDCAKELSALIRPWIEAEQLGVRFEVVAIPREFECWIIAALESLRGKRGIDANAASHGDPEQVRDAKGYITGRMVGTTKYQETSDQAALISLVDLELVRDRCPSFRRVVSKVAECAQEVARGGITT